MVIYNYIKNGRCKTHKNYVSNTMRFDATVSASKSTGMLKIIISDRSNNYNNRVISHEKYIKKTLKFLKGLGFTMSSSSRNKNSMKKRMLSNEQKEDGHK